VARYTEECPLFDGELDNVLFIIIFGPRGLKVNIALFVIGMSVGRLYLFRMEQAKKWEINLWQTKRKIKLFVL
jgi:hypothetical protein